MKLTAVGPSLTQKDINAFERHLNRNGVAILKFFLNVSKAEQKKRFLKRLEDPDRNWKFSIDDLSERERWDNYMHAYQEMIENTSTPDAPWYVVPADNKWYTRVVVAAALVDTLESLNLAYPGVNAQLKKELEEGKALLGS